MVVGKSSPDPRYNIFFDKGREIQEPVEPLKTMQQAALERFQNIVFADCVWGGIPNRSVIGCVSQHANSRFILKMDLKSFYRSITEEKIVEEIYRWRDEDLREELDRRLCEVQKHLPEFFCNGTPHSILPTGAPTSLFLANLAARTLDKKIVNLFQSTEWRESPEHNYCCPTAPTYTRYVDDLTFSFPAYRLDYSKPWILISMITEIARSEGFEINTAKTRWMTQGSDNMLILGVSIANPTQLKVSRKYRRDLRATLFQRAKNKEALTEQDQGRLAYVREIDPRQCRKLERYYAKCRT